MLVYYSLGVDLPKDLAFEVASKWEIAKMGIIQFLSKLKKTTVK